jgi:hypothetical protein
VARIGLQKKIIRKWVGRRGESFMGRDAL